jgi:hypothetical protein
MILVAIVVVCFALIGAESCTDSKSKAKPEAKKLPESAQKMQDIMADVRRKMNVAGNGFASEARLAHVDSLINTTSDNGQQLNLGFEKAGILLEIGREQEAVELYEKVLGYVKDIKASRKPVLSALGLAYMRLAERTNCVNNHSAESCIMPIQGNGVHQDKTPSRKAIDVFQQILKEDPKDLDAMWLLNIAYMTIGEYPKGVPAAWLVPGLDQQGTYPVKPFTDIASNLKLNVDNRSGGVIVDDFDNDGLLDIVTSAWGLDDPMHYYKNNGDGTFTNLSKESGLSAIMGGLNMVSTDYNNDGFLDIFVLRGGWQGISGFGDQPKSLLRNNGDGTFTDVTIDAGLLAFSPSQTATWNDFNNDGWLDVFIGNETTDPKHPHPCDMYINNGDGTFANVAGITMPSVVAFVKGVTSGDYDNDGWPDLFISTLSGQKFLLHNKGKVPRGVDFEDVSAQSGIGKLVSRTFPTWFFDYDNDGWLDIFMCNYEFDRPLSYYAAKEALHPSSDMAGKMYLLHNNHDGTFSNVTGKMDVNQTIFAMGSNFGDIDNDGYLDMYLGTGNPSYLSLIPNKLYRNMEGQNFKDVTVAARVGNLQKGHAVAFADLDNDGDQDIYADMGGAYRGDHYPAAFYLNPGQNQNHWLYLKLEGNKSNKVAIGAKITLKFHENGKERMVYRIVNSGGSFGCSPLRREIGIGQAEQVDEITINWPASGTTQVIKNVKPNQLIKITEGKEGYEPMALKTIDLKKFEGPLCAPVK